MTSDKVRERVPNKLTLAQQFPLTTSHLLFPSQWCMDGMIVKGRDYHFTAFQAQESALVAVAERATFPVKMFKMGFLNTAHISPVRKGTAP